MSDFEARKRLYCISEDMSVEDAVAVIEENNHRCVIVVGSGDRVVGTLSDGDVRKLILSHTVLSIPVSQVMNLNFKHVVKESGVDEKARLKEVLTKNPHISLIPVLDVKMILVEIFIREDATA